MLIRNAKIGDVKQIVSLIKFFADKGLMLERSEDAVIQNLRDFYVAIEPKRKSIVGCVSLHIYTSRFSEIKAFAVKRSYQRHGIGRRLIKRCLREAYDLGLPKVFALTYVPDYFRKMGFVDSDKNLLPEKIWSECNKCAKRDCCDENCLVYVL